MSDADEPTVIDLAESVRRGERKASAPRDKPKATRPIHLMGAMRRESQPSSRSTRVEIATKTMSPTTIPQRANAAKTRIEPASAADPATK